MMLGRLVASASPGKNSACAGVFERKPEASFNLAAPPRLTIDALIAALRTPQATTVRHRRSRVDRVLLSATSCRCLRPTNGLRIQPTSRAGAVPR
jgi:hypothetical protein